MEGRGGQGRRGKGRRGQERRKEGGSHPARGLPSYRCKETEGGRGAWGALYLTFLYFLLFIIYSSSSVYLSFSSFLYLSASPLSLSNPTPIPFSTLLAPHRSEEFALAEMLEHTPPEIQRTSLTSVWEKAREIKRKRRRKREKGRGID